MSTNTNTVIPFNNEILDQQNKLLTTSSLLNPLIDSDSPKSKLLNKLITACSQLLVQKELLRPNRKNYVLTPKELSKILIAYCDIVAEQSNIKSHSLIYYIYDPTTRVYTNNQDYLASIITHLMDFTQFKTVDSLVKEINKQLSLSELTDLTPIKRLPKHVIRFQNGFYDYKNRKFFNESDNNNPFSDYHVTSMNPWNFNKNPNKRMLKIIKKLMNDWSDGASDKKLLLLQIVQAVIKNDNMKKTILLKSAGGSGKSTYLTMLQNCVGQHNTVPMNYHDISDDEAVNQISSNVSLLIGDDLATRFSLAGKSLARFKSIVTQNQTQVNMKYRGNLIIQTCALWIQATNSSIAFYENDESIKRRVILLLWTDRKFDNKEFAKELDELVGLSLGAGQQPNREFYEAFIYYVLKHCDYTEQFTVSDRISKDTKELVESADILEHYCEHLYDHGCLDNEILPTPALYRNYNAWCRANGYRNDMKEISFGMRISKILATKYDFITDKQLLPTEKINVAKLTPLQFNPSESLGWDKSSLDLKGFQRYYMNKSKAITRYDIELVRQQLEDGTYDDENMTTIRILEYLAVHEQNPQAQSIVSIL